MADYIQIKNDSTDIYPAPASAIKTGTISRITTVTSSGTFQQFHCFKKDGIVYASAYWSDLVSADAVSANKSYFQLPAGFRPIMGIYVPAVIILQSDTSKRIPVHCFINGEGTVSLGYSSSRLYYFAFFATFPAAE